MRSTYKCSGAREIDRRAAVREHVPTPWPKPPHGRRLVSQIIVCIRILSELWHGEDVEGVDTVQLHSQLMAARKQIGE